MQRNFVYAHTWGNLASKLGIHKEAQVVSHLELVISKEFAVGALDTFIDCNQGWQRLSASRGIVPSQTQFEQERLGVHLLILVANSRPEAP